MTSPIGLTLVLAACATLATVARAQAQLDAVDGVNPR